MVSSHASQPAGGSPITAPASATAPSRSTRYCVSEAIVCCCVSVTPSRLRVDEDAAARRRRARGEHEQSVGGRRERHVALGPGEAPPVAVGLGAQLHALGAEPASRLEPRRRDDRLAGGESGQPLGSAPRPCRRARVTPPLITELTKCGRRRERPAELVVDDHRVEHRHPRAAVLLGQRQPEQAQLAELEPELLRVADGVVLQLAHDVEAGVARAHARRRSRAGAPARG